MKLRSKLNPTSVESNLVSIKVGKYNYYVDLLTLIVYDENNIEVFNFGKHKGKPVADILKKEPGYYGWMMDGDFPLNTKQVLTKIRLRELNQ